MLTDLEAPISAAPPTTAETRRLCRGALLVLLTVLLGAGCGSETKGKPQNLDQQTRTVMNVLSVFYGRYLDDHRGAPPADADAFRQYLQTCSDEFEMYHVLSVDQLITSPRDGMPFVIICGKRHAPAESPDSPWAAYEQEGVNGKRMAVRFRGGTYELSEAEISREFGSP